MLDDAGASEQILHTVVSLVARVFVERSVGSSEQKRGRPRTTQRRVVFHCAPPVDGVLADPRKALDHTPVGA